MHAQRERERERHQTRKIQYRPTALDVPGACI